MRARPFGGILQYQREPIESMLSRWSSHVVGWRAADSFVHFIAYEDLHRNFAATIQRIGTIIGIMPLASPAARNWMRTQACLGRVSSGIGATTGRAMTKCISMTMPVP